MEIYILLLFVNIFFAIINYKVKNYKTALLSSFISGMVLGKIISASFGI